MVKGDYNSIISVDLRQVKKNIENIKKYIGNEVELMITAKSNGYGHGLVEPASYIYKNCGIRKFATSMVSEAVELRQAGIDCFLMVLGGIPYSAIPTVVSYDLGVPGYDIEFLNLLNEEAGRKGKCVKIHLKIETGLKRIGVRIGNNLIKLVEQILKLDNLIIEGAFTHFAMPTEKDQDFTNKQLDEFDIALEQIKSRGVKLKLIHTANSDAVARCQRSYYNLVRPAALWLGYDDTGKVGVKPCITWKSFVSNVFWAEIGESVSYFGRIVMKKRTKIAILGFGGGDGYVRDLLTTNWGKNGVVLIRGKRVPLITLNMDHAYADVTELDNVQINDEAYLLGKVGDQEITMDELGRIAGTSTGHIQCSLGTRPFREYIQ